jgi:hypothetical protein
MSIKLNQNLINIKKNLYDNHIKTFTGFYSDSWNSSISTPSSTSWSTLAINEDGLIFVISSIAAIINYSSNGGNSWSSISVGSTSMRSIAYSKELARFVVVGNNFAMYSNKKNPIAAGDWITTGFRTQIEPGNITNGFPALNWEDIVYEGGLFIAVSSTRISQLLDLKRIIISRDGINWRLDTAPSSVFNLSPTWKTITYGNGTFIVAANSITGITSSRIIYSNNDGNTWGSARNDTLVKANNAWQDSTYSPKLNLFILVANSGSHRLIYSSDGQNWINDGISASINTLALTSVSWSPELEMFIAVASGSSSPIFITSSDGKNWTLRSLTSSFNNKTMSGIIWNKKHNNFIGCSSATAGTSNIFNTRPLGINSLQISLDRYFNKTIITEFSYLKENESEISFVINADFGISPIINVNIHNIYTIDIPFPSGINLNPTNGVIYGKYSSIEKISRVITVFNQSTGESFKTEITISFTVGKITIDSFYYYIKGSGDFSEKYSFIIDDPNNITTFEPKVDSTGPYEFRLLNSNFEPDVFEFNSSNGIFNINPQKIKTGGTYSFEVFVDNPNDTSKIITSTILALRRIQTSFVSNSSTKSYTWFRKETRYRFELWTEFGVIQLFPYEVTLYIDVNTYKTTLNSSSITPSNIIINDKTYRFISINFTKNINGASPPGYTPLNGMEWLEVGNFLDIVIQGPDSISQTNFFSTIEILGTTYSVSGFSILELGSKTYNYRYILSDIPSQTNQTYGVVIRT